MSQPRSSAAKRSHSAAASDLAFASAAATAAAAHSSLDISQPLLSRPTTSGWGKSTETIKCLVPIEVKEQFLRRQRELGYPSESDALRELCIVFAFGAEHLAKVHADRIRRLADSMAGIGTTER